MTIASTWRWWEGSGIQPLPTILILLFFIYWSSTAHRKPRTKVKDQAWAKWWTKIELVNQVMNQVVNQAKKKNKIAVPQLENQTENVARCQAGYQGVNQESQTKNQSQEPRTKVKNQAWVKWRTKIPRAVNQEPRHQNDRLLVGISLGPAMVKANLV